MLKKHWIILILSISLYNCSPKLGEYYHDLSRTSIKMKSDSTFISFARLNLAETKRKYGVWERKQSRTYLLTTLITDHIGYYFYTRCVFADTSNSITPLVREHSFTVTIDTNRNIVKDFYFSVTRDTVTNRVKIINRIERPLVKIREDTVINDIRERSFEIVRDTFFLTWRGHLKRINGKAPEYYKVKWDQRDIYDRIDTIKNIKFFLIK